MKKVTKALLLALCAVLLVAGSVLGTLAYLTARETVTNTFTVGNVDIDLDETKVDKDGKPIEGEDRVQENEYHLIPGQTYVKDPTVTVVKGSERSYVRMMLTITHYNQLKAIFGEDFLPENFAEGWNREIWPCVAIVDNGDNSVTYEFRYYATVDATDAAEDMMLAPLFTHIVVPGELTGEQMATIADMKIIAEGHAIQAATFEADPENNLTAEDVAWAAFDKQYSETTGATTPTNP